MSIALFSVGAAFFALAMVLTIHFVATRPIVPNAATDQINQLTSHGKTVYLTSHEIWSVRASLIVAAITGFFAISVGRSK